MIIVTDKDAIIDGVVLIDYWEDGKWAAYNFGTLIMGAYSDNLIKLCLFVKQMGAEEIKVTRIGQILIHGVETEAEILSDSDEEDNFCS